MVHMIRKLALVAGTVVVLGAGAAVAQQPAPPPMPPMPPMEAMMAMDGPMMEGGRHHRDPAAHAQHLRDALQLRADQEPALKAFLDSQGPMTMEMEMRHGADAAPMTAPLRAQHHADMAARMAAGAQKKADATKAFYAALSPSQQKAFDAMAPMGGPGMRMQRMEMRGGKGAGREERMVIIQKKAG
jgi:protein CpxP